MEDEVKPEEQELEVTPEPVAEEAPEAQIEHDAEDSTESVMAAPEMKALLESFKDSESPAAEPETANAGEVAEEAAAPGETQPGAPADEPKSWVTVSDRILARSLDIPENELEAIGSREELERLARVLSYVKPRAAADPAKPAEPEQAAEYVDSPLLADGSVNVEWYRKNDYDEGQITLAQKQAEALKEHATLKGQFEELLQTQAEQQRERDINDFHDALDRLDGEFFGKTMTDKGPALISESLGRRRGEVFAQLDIADASLTRRLGHAPTMHQRVELAARLAWAAELDAAAAKRSEAARKGAVTRLHNQSTKVRPVGSVARTTPAPKAAPNTTEAVLGHPEFKAMLDGFAEKNAN